LCLRYSEEVQEVLEPFIYEWIQGHSGSISAEHGIGLMKAGALKYSKSVGAIQVMSGIKAMLDSRVSMQSRTSQCLPAQHVA
jgi:hypothetical protein